MTDEEFDKWVEDLSAQEDWIPFIEYCSKCHAVAPGCVKRSHYVKCADREPRPCCGVPMEIVFEIDQDEDHYLRLEI